MLKKIICSVLIFFMICTLSNCSYGRRDYTYCGNLKLIKTYGHSLDEVEYWVSGVSSPSTTPEIKVPSVANDNIEITGIYDNNKSGGVFQSNPFLEKVDLSESKVKLIGSYCFKDCQALTEFINSKYLTEILGYAFQNANLNSITLYDGLEKIKMSAFEDAFSDDKNLYVIDIPDSVTEIGENAFKVTNKKYKVVLVGKKDSIAQKYCETDSTCTFMERGDKLPTEEELLAEEMKKEKAKLFVNPKFTFRGCSNLDDSCTVRYFGLPASTLTSENVEEYKDIIDVGDGLVTVGFSYIDKYKSDSKYWQETLLSKAKGNDDGIIIKYDYNLNMQFFKSFGGSLGDQFEKIYKMKNNRYLVLGRTCSNDKDLLNVNSSTNYYNPMAVIYDENFNVLSVEMGASSTILEKYKNEIIENEENSNGIITLKMVLGDKMSPIHGTYVKEQNTLITKYDVNGYKEWSRTFDRDSNTSNDKLVKAIEVSDGYVFIGNSLKTNTINNRELLVQDAIIVKYSRVFDDIIIVRPITNYNLAGLVQDGGDKIFGDGEVVGRYSVANINIGEQKAVQVYYVPWEDVTIGDMNWTSDNNEIATVDYKGNITGKKEGETTIHLDIRGKTVDIPVVVNNPNLHHIESVSLNKSECTLDKGMNENLIATIEPIDTTDSKEITWTSSNIDVATVNSAGLVTAVAPGTTTITATTSNGKTATCLITVNVPKKYTLQYNILDEEKKTVEVSGIEIDNGYYGNVSVDIPESVEINNKQYTIAQIGDKAFYKCNRLTNITIPKTVNQIGIDAFMYCYNLATITMPEGIKTIEKYAFYDCAKLTEISIPKSVTTIGEGAFQGCSSLTKIEIPEGVTNINDFTFSGCTKLTDIIIPESVTSIGNSVFIACNITNIVLPEKLTTIGEGAFWKCSNLKEIIIPNGVTHIENSTFSECKSLSNITMSKNLIEIKDYAFSECNNLIEINIPEKVSIIGDYAFKNCSSLKKVTMPSEMNNLGRGAFSECSKLTDITIPRISDINEYTFSGCSNLKNIVIPDCVFYICYSAFSGCENLTNIVIPNSVNIVGDNAFNGCTNLKDVTISNSVNDIGNGAFENCSENLIMKVHQNSYAHQYVTENGIKFEYITMIGDVNADGLIDAQDAVMILKHVAHNITLTEKELLAADTNKDGDVSAQDAVQILKYVAHNITEF